MPRRKAAETKPHRDPGALKGVRRALDLLDYIARHPSRAVEAAAGLGLSWATLHRTLSQLEQGGFLMRDRESNRYRIGPQAWAIGAAYVAHHPVIEAAQPYLDISVKGVEATVQLVERVGGQAVTLLARQTAAEPITKTTYGFHFPLHCGAKGQVLLAHSGDDFIADYLSRPLAALTPETITEPAALNAALNTIRRNGWAHTEGDVQVFTGSLAAPVRDRHADVVAAIALITKRSTLKDKGKTDLLLEALLSAAQSISIALGWRPGGPAGKAPGASAQRRSP